jgi:hypothetical protein
MPRSATAILIAAAILVSGCAHKMQIVPPLDNIRSVPLSDASSKNAGYYISAENRSKAVVTPGGGGDKVTYAPYKETEAALNTILSRTFRRVYPVPSMTDTDFINEKEISYIFTPLIQVNSSSTGIFTWFATDFTFELTCTAVDTEGNKIWTKTVVGEGHADYDEVSQDAGIAGGRAAEAAYLKMMQEISNASVF